METTSIRDLKLGMKGLTMVLITLEVGKASLTKDGHEIRTIRVADKSGSINLSLWDEPGTLLQPGDIVRVTKAYPSVFKNILTLYIGKGGELHKLGDFCLVFSETPNLSEEFVPPGPQPGVTTGGGGPVNAGASGNNLTGRPPHVRNSKK